MASEGEEVAEAGSHGSSKQMPNQILGLVSNRQWLCPRMPTCFFMRLSRMAQHQSIDSTRGCQVMSIFHSCPSWCCYVDGARYIGCSVHMHKNFNNSFPACTKYQNLWLNSCSAPNFSKFDIFMIPTQK